jgi:hypothetical protein
VRYRDRVGGGVQSGFVEVRRWEHGQREDPGAVRRIAQGFWFRYTKQFVDVRLPHAVAFAPLFADSIAYIYFFSDRASKRHPIDLAEQPSE